MNLANPDYGQTYFDLYFIQLQANHLNNSLTSLLKYFKTLFWVGKQLAKNVMKTWKIIQMSVERHLIAKRFLTFNTRHQSAIQLVIF